ncbi:hypothetical protein CcCBS67573_g05475 [Chytriomyces confervae]|uniref:Svf1-like C-terminal domain-containing protein n=1 Tax=Chytriomyces confervae TaxID=246404 RepID=A0A507FBY5_9FUNG|nr:putative cell survival pathways protein [Chytriomyces hyalinus]TPX73255.1 hypothetical protein CcCBS67573_g05475 [Chytriomyces confervae]
MFSRWSSRGSMASLKSAAQAQQDPPVKLPDPALDTITLSHDMDAHHSEATAADLSWRCLNSGASETFTFYMNFGDGAMAFVQMVYASLGLSPSVGLACRAYYPNGTKFSKSLEYSGSLLKLSNDNLNAECEELSIVRDNVSKKYTVKFNVSPEVVFNVTFEPIVPAFKVNSGKILFGKTEKDGSVEACFCPKARLSGSVTLNGVTREAQGHGLFHHVVQVKPQALSKWNFINFQSEDGALMLYEFEQKVDGGIQVFSQGCLVHENKLIAVTTKNRGVHVQTQRDESSGYEPPSQIYTIMTGKKLEEPTTPIKIEYSSLLTHKLDRIDLLAELPFLLRKLIQTFITAPFLFSWFQRRAIVKVTTGNDITEIQGDAFVECTFLMRE